MSSPQIINLLFFALGIASCLFIIFSISIRVIKNELHAMSDNFIKEIKKSKVSAVHR